MLWCSSVLFLWCFGGRRILKKKKRKEEKKSTKKHEKGGREKAVMGNEKTQNVT